MKAITREEKIISGENLTPITRKEMFLAKAAGMDIETPEPITREEMFLSKIGGSGGGSAVLAELVVTENGVYDEPVIASGLEPITWDGNTDGKVTIQPADTFVFAKISDKVFSVDDYIGSTLTVSDMSPMTVTSDSIMADDTYVNANGFVISILVPNAVVDGVVFPEVGTYVANMGGYCFISLTFAGGTLVPADGWNKVTVNVAGDIIDVDELPTENIEEGKIYRVTNGDIVTYGIPNAHPVKRFVDGAWVELA